MENIKRNLAVILCLACFLVISLVSNAMVTTLNSSDLQAFGKNKVFLLGGDSCRYKASCNWGLSYEVRKRRY